MMLFRFRISSMVVFPMAMCLSASAVYGNYADEIMKDDPIAYWRLDDDDFEAENLGEADAIAEYHDETEQQVPGLISTDPDNTAARFLGPDEAPDGEDISGVHVLDFPELNTGGPFDEKTILLWFQADDVDILEEQVMFEEGGSTRGLNLYVSDGSAYVGAWNRADDDGGVSSPWESGDDDPPGGNIYLSTPVSSGEVYQLGLVMAGDTEGIEGTLTGYLNGQPFGEKTGVGQMFNHGDDAGIGHVHQNTYFQSGNWNNGNGRAFGGVIDEVALFNTALSGARIAELYEAGGGTIGEGVPGDFNGDQAVDVTDIDLLTAEVIAGTNDPAFDLSGDGNVDQADRAMWIGEIKNTWIGDANLDGEFGSSDFVLAFQAGLYETGQPASWGQGDWNGDGVFGSGDFVVAFQEGGFEQGPRQAVNAVPEPSSQLLLMLMAVLGVTRLRRR